MKTILVVYTDKRNLTKSEISKLKRYSFNSDSEIKEGDVISSAQYNTPMLVVKVLHEAFKYYNPNTGEMSNTFNSTVQWEIKKLVIRAEEQEIVYAKII